MISLTRLHALVLVSLLGLLLLGNGPAQAQLGDIFMEDGDARLVFLVPEQDQVLLRVSVAGPQTLWFGLQSSPPVQFVFDLQDQNAQRVAFTANPGMLAGSQLVQAQVTNAGDYFLLLTLTPESDSGYIRVTFDLTQPPSAAPGPDVTPLADPMTVTFSDAFDNNSANWFVGQLPGSRTAVSEGALLMEVEGGGQAFSGFNVVPGSEQPFYYYTAQVTLEGDGRDSLYGLMFRLVDAANYYLFQVIPERGQWRFLVLSEGQWIKPFGWHDDSRILNATGPHQLGVWVLENLFIFTWDGAIVGHVRDSEHLQGGIGLFAEVSPEGAGAPMVRWDNVRLGVMPPGGRWGQPSLPEALSLSPEQGIIFSNDDPPVVLSEAIIGRWSWNDEANTQQMVLVFLENGDYSQSIIEMATGTRLQEQNGRWSIRENDELVLQSAGLPDQRYRPILDSSNLLLTLPELSNRVFVRIIEENEEE